MSRRAALPPLPVRHVDPAARPAPEPTPRSALARRWAALPAWARVTVIYVVTRLLTTAMMLVYAQRQEDTWQIEAQPDYFRFATIWDGAWYQRIAYGGYPTELPVNDEGRVTENAWAFMPVYPMVVRAAMLLPGLGYEVAAVAVSLVAGLGAMLALHRLLRRFAGEGVATFAVLLVCLGPVSPMFQVGYAEALHFWMLVVLLELLVDRRWWEMLPLVVVASLTRPTGLAWAFALLLVILHRYWTSRVRRLERFDAAEQRAAWSVAIASGVAGLLWLAACAIATGELFGYLDTEFAWRHHYTGGEHTPPFTPWFWAGEFWFGQPWGTLAVLAALAVAIVWFADPVMRRFGIELRMWGIAYFSYLFAVFYPQSSIFRLLLPLFPAVVGPLALPRSPLYRVAVPLVAVVAQVVWFHWMWFVIGHDWTPP
ncbi:MAG: hypothetical protein GXX90_01960 [Microbacteriaceae bacterium]|nr:hypothetical protein [Microbacteriaceae bacterium]